MMTDSRMRRNAATILLFAAGLLAAAALFVVLTGGFSSAAIVLRDPIRPLAGALALLAASWMAAGTAFLPMVRAAAGSAARVSAAAAAVTAAGLLAFALAWTSRAAGGSDSSCYVLQAEAFARGHATLDNPVARQLPGMPVAVFAPTGFLPAREYGRAVPICAPGLSLVMAAAYLVHPSAVFAVVPVTAALLVWLTFVYGRRVDDEVTGAWAAVLVACSPIVLYQSVQPMSDVPAAAAWMAALVCAARRDDHGALGAGVCASLAVLVRPNLALLVVPLPLLFMEFRPTADATRMSLSVFRRNIVRLAVFGLALLPGAALMLALNAVRYGSPLASGYGSTDALFSAAHVYANLLRYPRWVMETQTPFVLLALASPTALWRDRSRAWLALVSLLCAALLVATYFAYTVFDDWWYIRFLLPALPMAIGLSVAVLRGAARRLPSSAARVFVAAICLTVAVFGVRVALARHVTELQALESRFRLAGEYAGRALPADAVVIAVQESGSVRFHGRRDTIAWDAIEPDALDDTIARLRALGRPVYLALEDAEEPWFRLRFGGQRFGGLDWAPAATIDAPGRVRVYATAQR
jgi:hypothetical protein